MLQPMCHLQCFYIGPCRCPGYLSSWPIQAWFQGPEPLFLPNRTEKSGVHWILIQPQTRHLEGLHLSRKPTPYYCSYLQTISMNIKLRHRLAPNVDVLDLLRGDVLALCQLENVLFPVNDLQRAVLQNRRNVSSKQP